MIIYIKNNVCFTTSTDYTTLTSYLYRNKNNKIYFNNFRNIIFLFRLITFYYLHVFNKHKNIVIAGLWPITKIIQTGPVKNIIKSNAKERRYFHRSNWKFI